MVTRMMHGQNAWPWLRAFRAAFPGNPRDPLSQVNYDNITYDHIAQALGAYQRSQLFINSPWRTYLKGEHDALAATR